MESTTLQLLMDLRGLNDRGLGEKIGVSHPTIVRWRRGVHDLPVIASLAIDCLFGLGCMPGSATQVVGDELHSRWREFVLNLEIADLCEISCGRKAVKYSSGGFFLIEYCEEDDLVYVGDVSGHVGTNFWANKILSEFFDENTLLSEILDCPADFGDFPCKSIFSLVGEAERSFLLQYDSQQILDKVGHALYAKNGRNFDGGGGDE